MSQEVDIQILMCKTNAHRCLSYSTSKPISQLHEVSILYGLRQSLLLSYISLSHSQSSLIKFYLICLFFFYNYSVTMTSLTSVAKNLKWFSFILSSSGVMPRLSLIFSFLSYTFLFKHSSTKTSSSQQHLSTCLLIVQHLDTKYGRSYSSPKKLFLYKARCKQ